MIDNSHQPPASSPQPPAPSPQLDGLQDIVERVKIQSNFYISHPDYKPLELQPEVVSRFQQLPEELQRKYVSLQLRNFLYSIYFKGDAPAAQKLEQSENDAAIAQTIEIDWQLHKSNCGEGYFDPGWYILKQESDDKFAVQKNGLTLHILRRHLQPEQIPRIGDPVAIRMPRNLVETGFYVAVGNAGLANLHNSNRSGKTAYVYFNFSPAGAIALMRSLSEQLNSLKIGFTFKALSDPSNYPRNDAGVLYFENCNYKTIRQILQTVYAENSAYFHPSIPLFTKRLAPGIGLAEKPEYKETTQERFGLNRCQIVADGLLDAWYKGDNSAQARMSAIARRFSMLGIELQRPYLNANEDIYTKLDF